MGNIADIHIKKLVETGQTAEAQKIILAELNSQFGGSAVAAAAAGTGALTQIANAWGDVKEVIGKVFFALLEIIKPVVSTVIRMLGSLFKFILENSDVFKALAVGAAVGAAAFGVFKIATFLLSGGLTTLGVTALTAAKTITAAIFSIPLVGWIAAIIAALVALGVYLWNTSEKFRGFLFGLWEAVKTVFTGIGKFIGEVLSGVWEIIQKVFNPANWFNDELSIAGGLEKIKNAATEYGTAVGKAFSEGRDKGIADFEAEQKKKEEKRQGVKGLTAAGLLDNTDDVEDLKTRLGNDSNKNEKNLSLSGSGSGGSKSITMNVTMNNYFSGVGKNIEEVAEKVARRINDRLSDGLAAV